MKTLGIIFIGYFVTACVTALITSWLEDNGKAYDEKATRDFWLLLWVLWIGITLTFIS